MPTAVIVLDGSGWHRSADLLVPSKLTLLHLPPYNPELNPMEQIILFLESNRFANRVFKDVAALKEACRTAWQWLTDQSDVITKTTRRKWAVAPSCRSRCLTASVHMTCVWYQLSAASLQLSENARAAVLKGCPSYLHGHTRPGAFRPFKVNSAPRPES